MAKPVQQIGAHFTTPARGKRPIKFETAKKERTLQPIVSRYILSCLTGALQIYIFMYPGKKTGADPAWNCSEHCPADLIESLALNRALIDQDELLRAEWFWNRRPNVLCASLLVLFFYIVVFVCLLYCLPECAAPLLAWLLVGAGGVTVDCVRLDRWRREYELSIKRLILHLPKRK